MESEVLEALPTVVTECEGTLKNVSNDLVLNSTDRWVEVEIYDILLDLVTHVSNRVLLGEPDCHNKEWARASMNYAANVALTVGIPRLFPNIMRQLVALFVPAV